MAVLDEDFCEDVDGGQGREGHAALRGPQQVNPQHARQVGRAHLVHDALGGHLLAPPLALASR